MNTVGLNNLPMNDPAQVLRNEWATGEVNGPRVIPKGIELLLHPSNGLGAGILPEQFVIGFPCRRTLTDATQKRGRRPISARMTRACHESSRKPNPAARALRLACSTMPHATRGIGVAPYSRSSGRPSHQLRLSAACAAAAVTTSCASRSELQMILIGPVTALRTTSPATSKRLERKYPAMRS